MRRHNGDAREEGEYHGRETPMHHRKVGAEPLIQLDAKTTQQPLDNNSRKGRGSQPAKPATRLAPPKSHCQSNATATY